jgi:hypothetical protein
MAGYVVGLRLLDPILLDTSFSEVFANVTMVDEAGLV